MLCSGIGRAEGLRSGATPRPRLRASLLQNEDSPFVVERDAGEVNQKGVAEDAVACVTCARPGGREREAQLGLVECDASERDLAALAVEERRGPSQSRTL